MTTSTLGEYIAKVLRPGVEGLLETERKWERGREVTLRSGELARAGRPLEALELLDVALKDAVEENRTVWVKILSQHATAFAHATGDHEREIGYVERALPHAEDYRFAAYNFAQLLLRHGHADRAVLYANEAYRLSIVENSEADHDLRAAILRQWPDISEATKLA